MQSTDQRQPILKSALIWFGVCLCYIAVSRLAPMLLTYATVKGQLPDLKLHYFGSSFPCRPAGAPVAPRSSAAVFFLFWGPRFYALLLMAAGYWLLRRSAGRGALFCCGLILFNCMLLLNVLFFFTLASDYYQSMKRFWLVVHDYTKTDIVLFAVCAAASLAAMYWSAIRYLSKRDLLLLSFIFPLSYLVFIPVWFHWLGPLLG